MEAKQNDVINRVSNVPLHRQVAEHLGELISTGSLRTGDELPSEVQLSEFYDVSRSVIRQAFASLVSSGTIRTQKGRPARILSGDQSDPARDIAHAGGLAEDLRRRGKELRTTVVSVEKVAAPEFVQEKAFVKECWETRRVRFVDDKPLMYVINWIPLTVLSELSVGSLDGASLHRLIRAGGMELEGGLRRIRAMNPTPEVSEHLGVNSSTPVLQLTGGTMSVENELAEAFEIWHHPSFELETYASVQNSSPSSQLETIQTALTRLEEAVKILSAYKPVLQEGVQPRESERGAL